MAAMRERRVYRFGPRQRVHLQTKPLALLLYLIEHSARAALEGVTR